MSLIGAAKRDNLEELKNLISKGCNINHISEIDGCTALIAAAYNGNKEAVEILIDAGADLTIADKDGTAKENARKKGYKEIVEILEKAEEALEEHGRWLKVNSAEVANIQISHAINLKVTRIFNFSAMTLKEISKNTLTNAESSFILHFSDKAVDKRLLDKAREVFVKDGGVIDEKEFRLAIRYNNKPAYRVIRS